MRQMTSSISRKFLCAAFSAGWMAFVGPGIAAGPADPSGTWLTEDARARIRLERCGPALEQICGYIVWIRDPVDAKGQPLRDRQNPDPAKRSRALLGHQLLMGLTQNADGRFYGQIYNAENGESYEISLWREAADRLKVKGCMLAVFCASQDWPQAVNVLPGQLSGITGDPTGPRADKEWAQPPQAEPSTTAKATR
jgi:uncharacterized protein (DUF2147 family)